MKLISPALKITFIALLTLMFLHPFEGGGDFYHHVNTGKQILEERTFPYTDIYTHTAQGQPWIAHSWGSGIVLYLIYSWFGPISISILVSLTGAFTILLLYYLLRLSNVSKVISLLAATTAAGPILTRFPNRPEIFSYSFMLSILIIDRLRIKRSRLNWLFPGIILLWANFYGSSIIAGIGLIVILIFKQFLQDRFKLLKSQKLFYFSALTATLAAFINPNTYKTVFYMYIYIPKVAEYEGEWAGIWAILNYTPEGYLLLYQYLILIYVIYLTLFFLTFLISWKNILKQKFLLFLSPAILIPIFAFRHLPMAVLFSIPLIAVLTNLAKSRALNIVTVLSAFAMIAIMLWLRPIGINVDTSASDRLVSFINQNQLRGKAFNHSTTGSFLSYELYPDVKIFFDTRDDLYKDNPAFTDLYNAQMTSQTILPLLGKYKIDLVVADFFSDSLNYRELFNSPSWAIVYFDDRYFIAVPTSTAQSKNLQIVQSIDPFSPSGAKLGQEEQAEKYFRTLPETPSNQLLVAQTLIAQNKHAEAIPILENLGMPKDLTKVLLQKQQNYFLVKASLEVEDCQKAKTYLQRLQDNVKGNFIFDPGKKLQLIDDDINALYYLRCQNDRTKADFYMKQYLNLPSINPKEKIKFQQKFMEQAQRL